MFRIILSKKICLAVTITNEKRQLYPQINQIGYLSQNTNGNETPGRAKVKGTQEMKAKLAS